MKYEKVLERIRSGLMSRQELMDLRVNAIAKHQQGDAEAQSVIDAIDLAKPKDKAILFMGFCPNADFSDRQDLEWREKGICRFDYIESETQLQRFRTVAPGDLIVLKKREQFGKTMRLFGHGRVTAVAYDADNLRYLKIDWSKQEAIIEVPLMACNSTVDIRSIESVEMEMPQEFWDWLHENTPPST